MFKLHKQVFATIVLLFVVACQASYFSWVGENTFRSVSNSHGAVPKSKSSNVIKSGYTRDQAFPEAEETVNGYGYAFERHTGIKTGDSYKLEIWRIPGKLNEEPMLDENGKVIKKPVVLLWHGMMSSAITWINNSYQSIAYILADNGYDVWIANSRGNGVSQQPHETLSPHKKEFWNFSFSTIGEWDVPAVINYILKETFQPNLTYIGHSQGTSQVFDAMTHVNFFFKKYVNLFVALGPVARLNHVSEALKVLAAHTNDIQDFANLSGIYKIDNPDLLAPKIDANIQKMLAEENTKGMSLLDFITSHKKAPEIQLGEFILELNSVTSKKNIRYDNKFSDFDQISPVSIRQAIHYGQIIDKAHFRMYDYRDQHLNNKFYTQQEIPSIDINEVRSVPTVLIATWDDDLATPEDVKWLANVLDKDSMLKELYIMDGGHSTFMQAKDMSYFREKVMPWINRYNPISTPF